MFGTVSLATGPLCGFFMRKAMFLGCPEGKCGRLHGTFEHFLMLKVTWGSIYIYIYIYISAPGQGHCLLGPLPQ